jgi:alkanesulfonate monooxygenase SsuD/methylene tetrahydromethanopterin reductase-like flavin-dependent oxidoreductase (luciferase family)
MSEAPRPLGVGVTPMETRREVVLRMATLAEELGYTAFSVAEGWGYDAAVLLTEIAARTTRIELGTGVLNIWGRSPASIAMLAAGLAEASDGRFALGLGAGSPQLAEGWHDVPFQAPVRRMATVARQVRGLLDGERLVRSTGNRGLRLAVPPRSRVPLNLAALGPAAIRLCGELADAWYPFLMPMSGLKEGMCLLDEGAARAARPRPQICPGIPTAVLPDPDAAREVTAWWLAFYLTSMGPLYAATLRNRGFGEAVDAVIAANPRGAPHTLPAAAQVLADELLISGGPDAARVGLDRWYAAGAEMPVIVLPPNRSVEELEHTLRTFRP